MQDVNESNQINFIELATKQLTLLKPAKNENLFEISVKFTGYEDLFFFISNLIQLTIAQIHAEEDGLFSEVRRPYVDTARVLAIALQLIPHDEAKLLDALMELKKDDKSNI